MAANSKREQIILANTVIIETIDALKATKRVLPERAELKKLPNTNFPLAAVVGRIPLPADHQEDREGNRDQFISELKIDIFVYFMQRKDTDQQISNLLDDFWQALYQDQSRGGLVFDTKLIPTEKVNIWKPYAAFKLTIIHNYLHDTGGI